MQKKAVWCWAFPQAAEDGLQSFAWGSWSCPPSHCQSCTGLRYSKVVVKNPLLSLTAAKCGRCSGQLGILGRKDWAISLGCPGEGQPCVLWSCKEHGHRKASFVFRSRVDKQLWSQVCFTVADYNLGSHWRQPLKSCHEAGGQTASTASWRYSQTSFLPQLIPWHQCLHPVDVPVHPRLPQKLSSHICCLWRCHLHWLLMGWLTDPMGWFYRCYKTTQGLTGCKELQRKNFLIKKPKLNSLLWADKKCKRNSHWQNDHGTIQNQPLFLGQQYLGWLCFLTRGLILSLQMSQDTSELGWACDGKPSQRSPEHRVTMAFGTLFTICLLSCIVKCPPYGKQVLTDMELRV